MKQFKRLLVTFLLAVGIGYFLLVLVYALPKDRIVAHVADRATFDIFDAERNYPKLIANHEDSRLDNFTDAIMLRMASSDDKNNAFVQALLCPRNSSNGGEASAEDVMCMYLNEPDGITYYYSRYWHGYLIWLKPLLMFLSYDEVRYFIMSVDLLAFAIVLYLMGRRRREEMVLPFVISTLLLNIPAVCLSMQYTSCYMLGMLAAMVILYFDVWFKKKENWPVFFLIFGMLTCYFDFFTYPVYVFGLPMGMLLYMYCDDLKSSAKNFFINGVTWSVGFMGFWASKWILAQVFTGEDVIANALNEILFRTSDEWFEDTVKVTFRATIEAVWWTQKYYYYAAIAFAVVASLYFIFKKKYQPDWVKMLSMIVVGLVPFAWYFLTKNHSCMHTYMTYRLMAVTVFAIAMLGVCWKKKSGGK